ncbi:MAG: CRTAC1 family protein [Planctomycetaceae bacterium]|nr:CRTAC1 family protein [Planctomycetaceae bacterium]
MKFHRRLALGMVLMACVVSGCRNKSGTESGSGSGQITPEDAPVVLSVEDREEAIRLRNVGLAQLENKEWLLAEKTLAQLVAKAPANPQALRNYAICRVLMVIDRTSPFPPTGTAAEVNAFQQACAAASEAAADFAAAARSPFDRALADLFRGKLLVHISSPARPTLEEGLTLLRSAAAAQPDRGDFQMAVAAAMDSQNAYSDQQKPGYRQLLEELQKTFELAPDNLYVVISLLKRQALGLSSRDEATKTAALKITDTLQAALPMVATFNESIKKSQRVDLAQVITDGLEKFDAARPTTLISPGMMTFNLLVPELACQVDQRRINRNLLEYVQFDFDASFYEGLSDDDLPATVLKALTPTDGLPQLDAIDAVQVEDLDLDGRSDIVVARNGGIEVYSRAEESWSLVMTSPEQSVSLTGFVLADIDRDFDVQVPKLDAPFVLRERDQKLPKDPAGQPRWFDADLDVIAWGQDGLVIMHNVAAEDGSRSLVICEQDPASRTTGLTSVAVADIEFDGDLDLILGTTTGVQFQENLNGTLFSSLDVGGNLPEDPVRFLQIGDFNRDFAIDVGVVLEDGDVGILENALQARFRWLSAPDELATPLQLVMSAFGTDAAFDPGFSPLGVLGADFDNDTFADVLCYTADKAVVGRGSSRAFDGTAFPALEGGLRGAAVSDIDEDGDLDIIALTPDGTLQWLKNEGGNDNNWLELVTRGVPKDDQFPANRINMHAVGSTAELRAGQLLQSRTVQSPRIHFGLGQRESVDAIRVIWTDGVPQNAAVPQVLRKRIGLLHPQILKGSCPYIYTWNGEEFVFFSDCLWAAPIGLVQASGEIAPTREWENLLIPGELLSEKQGRYELQLTEELWEVAYFDQVELTAIDHPADVSIFTNEKVGPPSLAEHRVHTVREPRLPKSIVDSRGTDLLPQLSAQDGEYMQAFQSRVLQGLTDEWTMEFDLGDLPPEADRTIRLFLLGWIFPTDTSLNRHIETNPDLAPPAPPTLEVPDGHGGWKIARPFIGFPSGKTKAMVVDISDVLTGDNTRFRLRSTMELYFDQAFFTVNEAEANTTVQSCEPLDAHLHYRGFSQRVYADNALFRNGHAPEGYDYQSVRTQPQWPEIGGRFTRYGDVSRLTVTHDDQMVVMGPGDELTLRFAVPEQRVPEGWKRDFVLRNVGYDKDADLNTIYGQTSEPFPFRAMTRYPFGDGEQAPDSADYQQYLQQWQTRQYDPGTLRRALRRSPPQWHGPLN